MGGTLRTHAEFERRSEEYPMSRIKLLLAIAPIPSVVNSSVGITGETGRIQRNPSDAAEAERIASETAMNDSLLQKGDIVVTDRGFYVFRGVGTRCLYVRVFQGARSGLRQAGTGASLRKHIRPGGLTDELNANQSAPQIKIRGPLVMRR